MFRLFMIFLFYKVSCENFFEDDLVPTVKLPLGTLVGHIRLSDNNQSIYSFEGVPFAEPPVGKYRFEEPVPVKPWEDIWVAKTIHVCMQYNHFTAPGADYVIGDEDCLYMNIYTPTLDSRANLDVILYIHGGAFMFNYGGQMNPEKILDRQNVVYVNFNYRLGPLGFLSTEDDTIPANNGLRDQILALKFVIENIEYFGGNPNSITLMGMSAGGASVHLHYLMPKSRGLFHRGISQSGTALNPWVLMENPLEITHKIADIVGCPNENLRKIIECLKRKPAKQLVNTVQYFQLWLYKPFSPFGVVVDKWSKDPVLPAHPYNILESKNVLDVAWISSFTNAEGLYPASEFYGNQEYLQYINDNWNFIIPHILHYNYTVKPEEQDKVSQNIRKFYFGTRAISNETFTDLVELIGDRLFLMDIEKSIRLQSKAVKSPIYIYHFTYRGKHSCSEKYGSTDNLGASHADDTVYVFKTAVNTASTENDRLVSKLLLDIVTSFAKNGKPDVPVEWPSAMYGSTDLIQFLKIESHRKIHVEIRKSIGNRLFWETLPIHENEKITNIHDEL